MLSFFDPIRDLRFVSVLARILIAVVCGGLIGLERSSKNRPAGFRTHILVCIGAATAALTGHYMYLVQGLPADVTRIGAQVITGLGFIGAGTILVTQKGSVKGLTTAAGLWASGVAGLAIGAGFYEGGILTTLMILVVELVFSRINHKIYHYPELKITLHYSHQDALDYAMNYCRDLRIIVTGLQVTGSEGGEHSVYTANLTLRPTSNIDQDVLADQIRAMDGIIAAEVE